MANNRDINVGHALTFAAAGNEVLYKIYAADNYDSAALTYLGNLQLTSQFKESEFADLTLFFKHTFIEEDFKLRPDWEKYFSNSQTKPAEKEGQSRWGPKLPPW